ncbi:hypothetical protein [Histidinibacterium aquaticum]|uniref:Uncharacterized protein n=1 Tax=Histidinibacterium aquaticum TaxID=2613962 RepID=A0A5J5GBV2_9RHOB|nr:hypothetical protein [Histidinibacterium aquaticum]KAA9005625.1 hypothetical protein F3S47_17120 [Histidinibacterium aquaticum]
MRGPTGQSIFLASASFRRRRLRDAARMLPLFGAVLILLPLLNSGSEGASTAGVLVYLFGLWAVLIAVAAVLSRLVRPQADETGEAERPEEGR